ncbi:DHA2 family efflux MFS transporter permease subunit [Actinomadura sp. WAC 06369]|uniref:DHA2 family efflux MFS transporter permease subunit n=1 Tax=Actinomadura sp. WAC 06369 TaxID=2203193 RepID=UPI000F795E95|nr:DHA2 family efflux MFS transporter permease subunit [Actinomadura sp. WAC 06369]RSN57837.1 MFS transporter [Actinomadura sp. WAC 06369]
MSRWRGNPWAILLTLSLGFFMTLLDLTIVNIAIPSMLDKLDASLDQVLWVVNAYILVLAVLLITAGRLGDLWGKKNLFIAGVVVFTLASLVCGLAQDPAQLIAARAVQGLGAALLMPQTMSIIINVFPPERRGAALGVWGAVAGVSTIAGPTVGGVLVTSLDWRWIFFVNLPIGILVLALAVPILPPHAPGVRHRFDVPGVLLASAALFCLVFALTEGEKFGWDARIWGLLAAGAVLFAVFVLHQRGRQDREPLVPFSLFRDRNFTILNLVGAAVSVGMVGMFLPMTIYMQSVLEFSALKAGLVMAPSSVVSMLLAPLAGRLSDRIGGKFILMAGLTLYALGMIWLVAVAGVGTDWTAFIAPLVVTGLGVGGVFAPMATEATRNVPPQLAGAASGVNNTIRQMGSVLGGAAVGAVLQNRLAVSLQDEAAQRAAALPPDARAGFVDGFANAAEGGLEVGAGQTGAPQAPAGLPPQVADRVQDLAGQVFGHGFVDALLPTMAVPIAVVLLGAAACLGVKGHRRGAAPAAPPATVPAGQSRVR